MPVCMQKNSCLSKAQSAGVVLADQGTLGLASNVAGPSLKAESSPFPITPLLLILLSSSATIDHAPSQLLPQTHQTGDVHHFTLVIWIFLIHPPKYCLTYKLCPVSFIDFT